MTPNYWGTGGGTDLFYTAVSGTTEIDIRQELIDTFDGRHPEVPKAQPALLRRLRLDSDEKSIPCSCVHPITREPDKDNFCPICFGVGSLWDESYITVYRVLPSVGRSLKDALVEPGLIKTPPVVLYIRYSTEVLAHDQIVLVRLDVEGRIIRPMRRQVIYRLDFVEPLRLDRGRVEFYKALGYQENVKWLNAPSFAEQI